MAIDTPDLQKVKTFFDQSGKDKSFVPFASKTNGALGIAWYKLRCGATKLALYIRWWSFIA